MELVRLGPGLASNLRIHCALLASLWLGGISGTRESQFSHGYPYLLQMVLSKRTNFILDSKCLHQEAI